MRGKTLPQIGRIEISIIEESQPEILAFTQGGPRLHRARRRRHEARAGRRPAASRSSRSAASCTCASARRRVTFTYFNMEDPVVGGYSNAADRAAPRDRDGLQRRRVDPRAVRRQRAAGEPAAAAGGQRPRPVAARQVASTTRPARARCSTASASRTATATAIARRRTASRLRSSAARCPSRGIARPTRCGRRTWTRSASGCRSQQQTFAELLNMSRGGKLPMFNLGYRSLEPSGLPDPADAVGQVAARHQPVAVQAGRVRRRVRAVPAHARGPGAHSARAQDVRDLAGVHADDPAHVRRRQRALLPVAAGLLAVGVRRSPGSTSTSTSRCAQRRATARASDARTRRDLRLGRQRHAEQRFA